MLKADRRIGIAVLTIALLALIGVNRISGRNVPGQAVSIPVPPIPAVGSCLDLRGALPAAIDCALPHTAEVYQSWREGHGPQGNSYHCSVGVQTTHYRVSPDWQVPTVPTVSTEVRSGVPFGWNACVFIAAIDLDPSRPVTFRGSIVSNSADRPFSAGTCYLDPSTARDEQQIDCSKPHLIQRVGYFVGTLTAPQPVTRCADFAQKQIGAAAFAAGSGLRAVVDSVTQNFSTIILSGPTVVYPDRAVKPSLACNVVSQRKLVDSILGLGNGPLPFG